MNGSDPAYPSQELGQDGFPCAGPCPGLTKREWMATQMHKELIRHEGSSYCTPAEIAINALTHTDALIAALGGQGDGKAK